MLVLVVGIIAKQIMPGNKARISSLTTLLGILHGIVVECIAGQLEDLYICR